MAVNTIVFIKCNAGRNPGVCHIGLTKVRSAVITMPGFRDMPCSKHTQQRYLPDLRSTTDFLAVGRLAEGATNHLNYIWAIGICSFPAICAYATLQAETCFDNTRCFATTFLAIKLNDFTFFTQNVTPHFQH